MDPHPDPDPVIFVSDLQGVTKMLFLLIYGSGSATLDFFHIRTTEQSKQNIVHDNYGFCRIVASRLDLF
jgi:hypothetical protein